MATGHCDWEGRERPRLCELIQRDEGGRGIKNLLCTEIEDHLWQGAESLAHVSVHVGLITGFPCCLDFDPPTETDGPAGTLAVARTLLALGKEVTLWTDECNSKGLLAAARAHPVVGRHLKEGKRFFFRSFGPDVSEESLRREAEAEGGIDHWIAIERAGPASDGNYFTMRGRDMTSLLAPLHLPFLWAAERHHDRAVEGGGKAVVTIGIGDGGNEVGMGTVVDLVRRHIPLGDQIACIVPADFLIVASVSNWGGYALACAVATVSGLLFSGESVLEGLEGVDAESLMPTLEEETLVAGALKEAGVRDGCSSQVEESVDGFPLSRCLELLEAMRESVLIQAAKKPLL
uniref:D-glutamate cyclase-like C-terminal domain-containing protein n=1 Tax=Chromera velia CCMP2878 TaxID=1169474 RepID=A0A0G4F3E7_9ALVE|mmetsp:Transcript_45970/g.90570  ORF Transcript_45970/g.90570 Transcript_45970/m.90570 type:complete len:347 (-) Transcript_45970:132-1172(-)|eukprot:Cvel_2705.t1-p1 / transcript=Cvel_2705.t1 / gene=Cvel_2705 / organism=Chromera_velia_CCMP2878 / gene_product=UPF0317 protein C14orf159 homolog, mitochondrial, putative / transcript_product=UPF0317 protein C14orf159 homolog, mitochondrial, putative / location=Cvel_scaffold108:82248-86393(+) / protein_length=346 / sequence_SO=supercontig / SO=protein_coding / is_pseudo=false